MARISKEEQARQDGMDYALRLVERDGLEALKKRCSRNMRKGVPAFISDKQYNDFIEYNKKCCIKSFMCIMAHVLRYKYGFGEKRLEDFRKYFLDVTDSVGGEWVTFDDIVEGVKAETGVDLSQHERFADQMLKDADEVLKARHEG